MTKTCLRCGSTKPLEGFHRDKQKSDGRRPYCRTCVNAEAKARAEEILDRGTYSRPDVQECSSCREVKPHGDFSPDGRRPSGIHRYCRPCVARRKRERTLA